jgi:hypothetical protein
MITGLSILIGIATLLVVFLIGLIKGGVDRIAQKGLKENSARSPK